MKLLKLEIGDLPKEKQFRSLHAGFKVEFHSLDNKGIKAMESFSPFCFAGLNGSGKSNVLEALAVIFYHMESCVAKFKPKTFATHFRPNECNPDAFTLEYLIGQHNSKPYALEYFEKIIIKKEKDKAPLMWRQLYPFTKEQELIPVSLEPKTNLREPKAAEGKEYLPEIIVGYSSGENETLSLPFKKSRIINFEKYKQDFENNYKYEEPENSLIYIDSEMSQAVLLTNLIFEDRNTLNAIEAEIGIVGALSFRLTLTNILANEPRKGDTHLSPYIVHIKDTIDFFKLFSTCCHTIKQTENFNTILTFDFFVDEVMKTAFRNHFSTSFNFFRTLQVLYELNFSKFDDISSPKIKSEILQDLHSPKDFLYTDGRFPLGSIEEIVFFLEDFLILKREKDNTEVSVLKLRDLSDGEHQFLHTIGICLMLKDRKTILLLDEPETHFNPSWRAKFIKILDNSIKAGNNKEHPNGSFNVHSLKDILLTSHSPFIISDCMPNNVIFFDRNVKTKKIQARKASELGFNTYGTSVEIILDELFDYNQSIGDLSNEILKQIDFQSIKSKEDIEKTKKLFSHLGESIEKDLVLARLNQIKFTT